MKYSQDVLKLVQKHFLKLFKALTLYVFYHCRSSLKHYLKLILLLLNIFF